MPPYIKDRCSFPLSLSLLPLAYVLLCDYLRFVACGFVLPTEDVTSTAAPNTGFISSSVSSTISSLMDYEVEVVEIRVKEGELKDIIP